MISITLNGIKKEFENNTTYYLISKGFNMENNVLAVRVNNEVKSLNSVAHQDAEIEFVDLNDLTGNKIYKSGLEFLFEVALKEAYPELDIVYQHSVPKGFLGEIVGNKVITQEDIVKIKGIMARIVSEDLKIKKLNVKKKDALAYYESKKQYEKYKNVQNITDKVVTLYELKGIYNYFYSEMPYSTSSINNYDIIYLGRNRLIFVIPTKNSNGILPEYVHYDNIINSFLTGKTWLDIQNMKYAESINNTIGSGKIKDFIKSCELVFNMNISKIANNIISNRNIKFVLIAGPSSSGKTTTTKRLASYFRAVYQLMISFWKEKILLKMKTEIMILSV